MVRCDDHISRRQFFYVFHLDLGDQLHDKTDNGAECFVVHLVNFTTAKQSCGQAKRFDLACFVGGVRTKKHDSPKLEDSATNYTGSHGLMNNRLPNRLIKKANPLNWAGFFVQIRDMVPER